MGFFSWKTCDTDESIPAAGSGRPMKPVYLLQPNGQPPVKEECYEGYGVFGGLDTFSWLVNTNAAALGIDLSKLDDDDVRSLGISLDVGHVCKDIKTGEIWSVFQDATSLVGGRYFAGNYAQVIPELGASASDLMASGRFKSVDIKEIVDLKYPLKFSFNPKAAYEDLPASEICPDQGFFYEDDKDEEDDDNPYIIPDGEPDEDDDED